MVSYGTARLDRRGEATSDGEWLDRVRLGLADLLGFLTLSRDQPRHDGLRRGLADETRLGSASRSYARHGRVGQTRYGEAAPDRVGSGRTD